MAERTTGARAPWPGRARSTTSSEWLASISPGTGPNLSLRSVARDLDMVSSGVYRYFDSRDALLTALIIDAYDDLGAVTERAEAAVRRR